MLPGEKIEIWERAYDKDTVSSDDLSPTIRELLTPPPPGGTQTYVVGNGNLDVEMSHTIVLHITDVTPATPGAGTLTFGVPQYGPNADTGGRLRVSGETPVSVSAPAGTDGVEYRVWPDGQAPGAWQYDLDGSDGFAIDLPDTGSCVCVVEWATIDGTGAQAVVSVRTRQTIELDNVAPTLVVPADFSVYANRTAGALVEYAVSATDDFPGPIALNCSPGSGTIFTNGANAPLATTVSCTATDAVDNKANGSFKVTVVSPVGYVNDYGLVVAHIPRLGARVRAGEVLYVDRVIADPSATFVARGPCNPSAPASLQRCAYVPLWASLPPFLAATPGPVNLDLRGTGNLLVPGSYGNLKLRPNSTVTLAPGDYSFGSIELLQPGARLEFSSPTTVRVADRLSLQSATVAPVGGASAHDLVFHVGGTDGRLNQLAVDIQPGVVVHANINAPNGTVAIGNGVQLTGAVIGRRVDVGSGVTVTKDSAFLLP